MKEEFQLAICPHCREESVRIPIQSWDTSYERSTGIQGFFPNVDLDGAYCINRCFLTKTERQNSLEVVDHIYVEE